MNPKLAIIIPFGTSEKRDFINERVIWKLNQLKEIKSIEVIFVEGFSSKPDESLRDQILKAGCKYVKDNSQKIFSVGACRNIGVTYSSAPVFMFLDVDYYISNQSIERLIKLIEVKQIDKFPNRFIGLPCAFLTEEGTNELLAIDNDYWDTKVSYDLISEKNNLTKFLAITSSSIVMNRHKFLELGGNDLSYKGHGYEDFDFYYRLFKASCRMDVPPKEIDFDAKSWNFTEYKGFRALFSVAGYESAFYGIYLYHFWHPEPNNDGYLDTRKINHDKFYQLVKSYTCQADGPDPLILAKNSKNNVLAFVKENSKVYRALRGITPYLGKLICVEEKIFFDANNLLADKLTNLIDKNNITHVLFPNAYGNKLRLEIYRFLKSNGIKTINFDRGALPDSWFFDTNGFNYESRSYDKSKWDFELKQNDLERVRKYIDELKNSDNYLEQQNTRVGGELLRQKLGLRNKRIIFVPGQVEYDTVIKYFSDSISYYEFYETLNKLASEFALENIAIVVKTHPLMKNFPKEKYRNLVWAPDNTNISDLLECCDKVVTINSGVGLYALIYGKPCATVGHAFYEGNGLAIHCKTVEDLKKFISEQSFLDSEKVLRFTHYLVFNFYCFGKSYYSTVTNSLGETRKIVNFIDFYRINFSGICELDGISANLFRYSKDLLAFRPYAESTKKILNSKSTLKSIPASTSKEIQKTDSKKIQNDLQTNSNNSTKKKTSKRPFASFIDFLKKRI